MTKMTKQQIIDEIFALYDESHKLYSNELKALYEEGAITGGSYWYLLSPLKEYSFKVFFGDYRKNGAAMFSFRKIQRTNKWHYEYILKQAQQFVAKQKEVIELREHII